MDAIKFMKEKKRMCSSYSGCTDACLLRKPMYENGLTCLGYCFAHPEEAVEIVEKWSSEHPKKTRQSEFLKMFPDARINSDGVIDIDPCYLNKKMERECDHKYDNCDDCYKDYWLSEVK